MKSIIKNKKFWIVLIMLAGCTVGAFLVSQNRLQIDAIEVCPQAVCDTVTEKGIVKTGIQIAQIAQTSGAIQEICVRENQSVKAGDILLYIDPTDIKQELLVQQSVLKGYEAQMEALQNRYAMAESLYQKHVELYEMDGISEIALNECEATYLDSAAQIAQMQSNIDGQCQLIQHLQRSLQYCIITAAADGVVTDLPVQHLSAIQAGQTAVMILNQKDTLAEFELLYSEVPMLTVGDKVSLTAQLRSGDIDLMGTIVQIYDFAEVGVSALGLEEHRVKVIVSIEPSDDIVLKEGYEIQGQFQLYYADDMLTVPNSALFKEDNAWYVFAVQDGVAVKTQVKIGYQAVGVTEIREGLSDGDVVVKNTNTENLADGVRVKYSNL